ncbi:ATP-binding protein [Streptomyces sp. NBC_00859]|uniref:ATP-binding protein n=1 Tax=Streptomyces sp. NBC_00859 TaxID=2903682 RepID=UPI00386CF773|nr:ATP-binding protein [Streptomyces sp. NBC_00859]
MIHRLIPATERARLTALYGGLLVLAGCILVVLIYLFVQDGLDSRIGDAFRAAPPGGRSVPSPTGPVPGDLISSDRAGKYARTQTVELITSSTLSRLLTVSGIALGVFAVLSVFLAWWMAGRVLRPVGVIAATARKLSGDNLHQRIDLTGPPGELKDLADTFDRMLGRLEHLVTAQQRFAANAAHELRTPLAIQRAAAEIGLADPDPERVQWIRGELIHVADRSEHLIESLLLLATAQQDLERRDSVRLEEAAAIIAADVVDEAEQREITVTTTLEPTTVAGDPVLLSLLIRNLVDNALRYNHRGGTVRIGLHDRTLTISNSGPLVPADDAPHLFEPFRRLNERTHSAGEGAGLGLSIVASVAHSHGAEAAAEANPDGGLTVAVDFGGTDPLPG